MLRLFFFTKNYRVGRDNGIFFFHSFFIKILKGELHRYMVTAKLICVFVFRYARLFSL